MRNKLTFSVSAIMLVLFLLLGSTQTQAQYRTSVWEKSAKLTTKPLWMGTDTERGAAFGNNKLYVVSRKYATNVYTVDANTGDSTGALNVTGVTGGTFPLSDVEVAADGAIYAANVTTNALTSAFKIYRWANDAAAPVEVINFTGSPQRLGDKFTVVGSAADNSLTIYAPAATNALSSGVPSNIVYRWTTADFGASFVRDSIVLTAVSTTAPGSTPAVFPLTTGISEFAWKANGTQLRRFNADGTVIDSVNTNLIPSGASALVYFLQGGKKYISVFVSSGTPQNGLRLVDVTNQYNTQHLILEFSPSIGTTTNTNATGDVDLVSNGDGSYDAYLFATNNGLAKYKYYFNGLPDVTTVNSFPYSVDFVSGLITDAGWSGNFIGRGTESKTNYAASFLYNYLPSAQLNQTFGHFVSPKMALPANHRVKFWWKDDDITATINNDTTFFEVSIDNGVSWTTLGFLSRASNMSAYEEAIFDLSAYAGNNFRMRWRDKLSTTSGWGFGLDDILIEPLPMVAVIALNPTTTAFGSTYIGGNMQKTVVVSNNGGVALTGTLTLPAGITANTTSLNVPNGQSFNLLLTWTPTTPGAYSDSIRFVTNDATASDFYYKLTGTAVTPFILNEVVQNFDTSTGTIPANWTGNYTVNASGGIGWSKRLTRNLWSSTPTGFFTSPLFASTATSVLKFKYRAVNYSGYGTGTASGTPGTSFKIYVSVSTNYGGSFTVVDSIGAHNHVTDTNYVEKIWNLSAYAGQTIQVKVDGNFLAGDFYSDFDDWFMGTPAQVAIDWGNLQWPLTATITQGDSLTAYGQAYKGGVTDSTGQAFGLKAWVGVSATNTDPSTWTSWTEATFNVQTGNNDEFMASFGKNLAVGTYYYAYRYEYLGGPYRYGGTTGFWDGTTSISGVLTVNPFYITSFPYFQGFEDAAFPPTAWARVDRNGGTTWNKSTSQPRTGTGHARYSYSGTLPGDDWLIAPGVQLNAGQVIEVSYWYKAQAGYPEKLKLWVGTGGQLPDSLTTSLADHSDITNSVYENNSVFFTAPAAGVYYFGFQAYSVADQWHLDLDDITFSLPKEVDYAAVGFTQVMNLPSEKTTQLKLSKSNPEMRMDFKGSGVPSSNVNNSTIINSNLLTTDLVGLLPVHLMTTVKRLGSTGPAFTVNASFNSVGATPINRPGIGTIGGTEDLFFTFNATARGTFSAFTYVTSVGDSVSSNDSLVNHKVRVYPDSAIVVKNDDYENNALTSVGFGTNNLPMTAGARFTAAQGMRLANIDAIYRNEGATDSIVVKVWAAGTDTLAPGAVLYTKSFAGENYINPGTTPQLVTLPLGDDAPTFAAGSDFWVSISFVAAIQYPMAAHAGVIPVPGRSFGSQDGGATWFPLVLSSVPYAWVMRPIGIPYTAPPAPVYSTLWQKSAAQGSLPSWFGSNTERGFAYGKVNDGSNNMVDRLFVVSRSAGNMVRVVDATTGDDAGSLTMDPIISGGLIVINDVEVTYDGKILASNVVGSTVTAQDWKVYMWDNLTSTPVLAMTYVVPPVTPNTRLGDKFRVTGNFYNNTAIIWAADAANAKVYKFSMSGGAFNPVPEIITLSNNAFGGSASVAPLPDGSFYYNAAGKNVMKYSATGIVIDTIPGTVIATGSNSVQYLGSINRTVNEYILTFAYGAGNENGFMATIPDGDPNFATFYGKTPTLGVNANANGTGDVAYMNNTDGTLTVFTLSSNNGFGAYKLLNAVPVELASFNATANVNNVNIDWVTSTETNSADFIIERKSSNGTWQSAGSVKAAGTSTSSRSYSFIDRNVATGKYSYRLKQIDFDGSSTTFNAIEVEVGVPAEFDLSQNYPNPFNPSTRVNFSLPTPTNVTLDVFDISGQKVATILSGYMTAGYHTADIDAQKLKLSSGIYIYKLSAGKFTSTKKMILMK